MPIRQVEMDDNLRIWRSFSIGNLLDLMMLDTRQYDRSITDLYWNTDYIHEISNDAGRTMMGSRQENWFYNQLSASQQRGAAWRLIGSQAGRSCCSTALAGDLPITSTFPSVPTAQPLICGVAVFSHRNLSRFRGDENPVDYDSWEGYQSNRNRTFAHMYNNNISNNIMMSGDSHLSWVSDLV